MSAAPLGVYLHVPFCVSKCPYCDFYSLSLGREPDGELLDRYTAALERDLRRWGERLDRGADTLYFGGGTPSLLGARRLTRLLETAATAFSLSQEAEITLEVNPGDGLQETLSAFSSAGGNRISVGMQSARDDELVRLGRRHRFADVRRTVEEAQRAGLSNLSLDLMLAIPGQTEDTAVASARTAAALGARHASAYLLKIEEGTPFYRQRDRLSLPNDEETADRYLAVCHALEEAGLIQYEISNFAHSGFESRHNRKYWLAEDTLGLGPAAHSFLDGRRLKNPRSLEAFLDGSLQPEEEPGPDDLRENSEEEYLMLRLRLREGVTERDFQQRFGHPLPLSWRKKAGMLPPSLIISDEGGIRLTQEGFLVSNAIILQLLSI